MKQLTCEICGGTDIVKQDGMYVCQSCGTKYSTEEAKKMMIEGTVDVSGSTIKVDSSGSIANFLRMAQNAYDAENKAEAEAYCNKVLEIDDTNYAAWLLKGKAAGWQSTVARIRIDEAINCFTKAIDNSPEDKLEEIKADVSREVASLTSALINLCCKNFTNFPSQDNANSVINSALLMKRVALDVLVKCGTKTIDLSSTLATTVNNAAMDAWNHKIGPEYYGNQHPSKFAWEHFVEQGDAVISMLETAVALCDDDNASDAIRYSNLIAVETKICDSASYKYDSTMNWQIEYQLNISEKTRRQALIEKWHKAWHEIDSSHVVPSAESVRAQTTQRATAQAKDNSCVCWATVITVIIAIIIAFLS